MINISEQAIPRCFVDTMENAPIACVDIGGSKVSVTLVRPQGLAIRAIEPTAKVGTHDALARQVIALIGHCCTLAHLPLTSLSKVGVSSCGPFVLRAGSIELAAPNICEGLAGPAPGQFNDWRSAPLEAPLRRHFKNLRLENDGIAALEAERRWGALRDGDQPLAHCAYVTWSTGIGMGLCVDGRVLHGKNGNAGHGGHLFVTDDLTNVCGCGNVGDVESLIGGNAIERRFRHLGYCDAAALFAASGTGDAGATDLIDGLCRVMARALYNLVAMLDLQRISIGGGLFWPHRDKLLPRLRKHMAGKLPAMTDGCQVVEAGLGERVGDFAALSLVV